MRAISYKGQLVALATDARVYLAPEIASLSRGDPVLRFVAVLCLYSRDVDTGRLVGPYRSEDAELYARCVLMPDEEFKPRMHELDVQIAERFRVPVEQVTAKRCDVADGA